MNAPAFIARPKPVERILVSSKAPDVLEDIVKTFTFGETISNDEVTARLVDVELVVVLFNPVKF